MDSSNTKTEGDNTNASENNKRKADSNQTNEESDNKKPKNFQNSTTAFERKSKSTMSGTTDPAVGEGKFCICD
jgi:hypothetical protein